MKVYKLGDNIDTDVIIPARYLNYSNMSELAQFTFIDIDTEYAKQVEKGDIIIGGENFGCGSSREHAPLVIKELGVSCVIAKSFARIFYRNAINIGLPILECPEAVDKINKDDEILVDFESGEIINKTKIEVYKAQPFPTFMKELIECGGLVEMTKKRLEGANEA